MAIFKYKMCGGSLDIQENTGIAVCEYCGSEQTIPREDDNVRTNLFNRANNLRLKCEFDKAQQVYDKILDTDNSDAEAPLGSGTVQVRHRVRRGSRSRLVTGRSMNPF